MMAMKSKEMTIAECVAEADEIFAQSVSDYERLLIRLASVTIARSK